MATMLLVFIVCISFKLFSCIEGQFCSSEDNCRQLEFKPDHTFNGKRLKNHVIHSDDVMDGSFCEMKCYMEANCVSYNLKKVANEQGKYNCELNNSTFEGHKEELETNSSYLYRGAKNACLKEPCQNNATCQTGFTVKGYQCLCTSGFKGSICNTDIDECATEKHNCSVNAFCNNTKGSYNCTCNPGYFGDGSNCDQLRVSTCKEIYDNNASSVSKAYPLTVDNEVVNIYCHMTMNTTGNGPCGGGGWTLVMKIDGKKETFHYNSSLWSNKETFNLTGGETGFDTQETKLPTYWNTSFCKICLGMNLRMKVDGLVNFVVIQKQARSLHSLIADGKYRATSLGRNTWKTLLGSEASLQEHCGKEGFNVLSRDRAYGKARIGILGNNENDCETCDSRIGFGTGGKHDDFNTCGNEAISSGDNGDKDIKAMGFIFVQ